MKNTIDKTDGKLMKGFLNGVLYGTPFICFILFILFRYTFVYQSYLLIGVFTCIFIILTKLFFSNARSIVVNGKIKVMKVFKGFVLFFALYQACNMCNFIMDGVIPYLNINSESNDIGKNQIIAMKFSNKFDLGRDEVNNINMFDKFELKETEDTFGFDSYLVNRLNLDRVFELKLSPDTGEIEFYGCNISLIENNKDLGNGKFVKIGKLYYKVKEDLFEEKVEFSKEKKYGLKFSKSSKEKIKVNGLVSDVYMDCRFWEVK